MLNYDEFCTINQALKHYYYDLCQRGYTPFCVCLTGSQCYNLHDEHSDIDAVAWCMPEFEDIAYGRPLISKQVDMANGAHCTLMDIRGIIELFKKGDFIHYIPLYSMYYAPDEFIPTYNRMLNIIQPLLAYNLKGIVSKAEGMMWSHIKGIEKETLGWNRNCGKKYVYIRWLYKFVQNLLKDKDCSCWSEIHYPFIVPDALKEELLPIKRGQIQFTSPSGIAFAEAMAFKCNRIGESLKEEEYKPDESKLNEFVEWYMEFFRNYYWEDKNV